MSHRVTTTADVAFTLDHAIELGFEQGGFVTRQLAAELQPWIDSLSARQARAALKAVLPYIIEVRRIMRNERATGEREGLVMWSEV